MRDSVNLKLSELVKDLIELTVQRGEAFLLLAGLNGIIPGLERVAIMAALNISHELLALKNGDNPVETSEEQERLSALNSQLDEVLYQLRQLEIN